MNSQSEQPYRVELAYASHLLLQFLFFYQAHLIEEFRSMFQMFGVEELTLQIGLTYAYLILMKLEDHNSYKAKSKFLINRMHEK